MFVVQNTITSLHFVVRISVSIYARNPVRLQTAQNSGRLPFHQINCITSATFYIHYVLYLIYITSIYSIPFAYFLLIPLKLTNTCFRPYYCTSAKLQM